MTGLEEGGRSPEEPHAGAISSSMSERPVEPGVAAPTETASPPSGFAESGSPPAEPKPSAIKEIWKEWVWPFLVVLLVVCTFRSAVADWNDVPTGSMTPTILPGERIFVNKIAYDLKVPFTRLRIVQWDDPKRGDVVVLFSPSDDKRLVKRVVGVPGDVIEMRRNRLFVNGAVAEYEPYGEEDLEHLGFHPPPRSEVLSETVDGQHHPVLWQPYSQLGASFAPLEVPPHHYFVMGDNRNQSRDSRWFGFVDRSAIVGQATAVVISWDKDKRYFSPRWNRFFLSLP